MDEALSPEDRALLAGELALGVLTGAERVAADRLRGQDAAFAAEVDEWEHRLAGLYAEIAAMPPGGRVWAAVESRLPANDADPAAIGDGRGAGGWKLATAAFAAIAATLAVLLIDRPDRIAPSPAAPPVVVAQAPAPVPGDTLVAQLGDGEGGSMLAVRVDTREGVLRVRATSIPDGAGEPELWVIPAGGAPASLGLIAREGESAVRLAGATGRLIADGATLALTLEPARGAPHAAPSGDILGTARITRI